MKPVYQSCIDPGRGDCQRAVIASLFDLELEQVPNFRLYPDRTWFNVYYYFLRGLGFEYKGTCFKNRFKYERDFQGIDGYFVACVPSKTFSEGITHAVVINEKGMVAHDPNPNKRWLGINVIESGELKEVNIIEPYIEVIDE